MDFRIKHDISVKKNANLCVFASYHADFLMDDFIFYYLNHLFETKFDIVFVSNSEIAPPDLYKLKKICKRVIEKENVGLDFTAYKAGLLTEDYGRNYETLLLTNVSIYGPLFPLKEILKKMKDYDFWGLTENYEFAYHLQSYFLHFNSNVLNSDVWKGFWDNVQNIESKEQIIINYEIGLTRSLIESSLFNHSSHIKYFDFLQYLKSVHGNYFNNDDKTNLSLYYWDDIILKYKFPFLKKTLIDKERHWNEMGISVHNWKQIIESNSSYPTSYILQ